MKTVVRRIILTDPVMSLDTRIEEICDVHLAAGLRLSAVFVISGEVVLIFQSV
jgi:hypothetical protein